MIHRLTRRAATLTLLGALAVPTAVPSTVAADDAPTAVAADSDSNSGGSADRNPSITITAPTADEIGGEEADDAERAARRVRRQAERTARRAAERAERQALVAEKLGVTPEELRAARLASLAERLDERVADGRISRDRADEILRAAEEGRLRDLRREARAARRGPR